MLIFEQHEKKRWQRRGWYTIDYERLKALLLPKCGRPHVDMRSTTLRSVVDHTSLTETTNKDLLTTNKPTLHPVVVGQECLDVEEAINRVDCQVEDVKETPGQEPNSSSEDSSSAPGNLEILTEVEQAGIHLHPKLKKLVLGAAIERVRNAIAVVKERQAKGRVKNPSGLFVEAVKRGWTPSKNSDRSAPSGFSEWYTQAKSQGLVQASLMVEGVQKVILPAGALVAWSEVVNLIS